MLCLAQANAQTSAEFPKPIAELFKTYCYDCHSADVDEGNLKFDTWQNLKSTEQDKKLEQIVRAIQIGEMPPEGSPPLSDPDRSSILQWGESTLRSIAAANANEPGDVVLRRLSNTEYTFTIQDLTGVASLFPAAEFPGDNAAGEGFTNAGAAMVMSPGLFDKYLDAAKSIAEHAVLLPNEVRFSATKSNNDWSNESLEAIKRFYAKYTKSDGAESVNLQGVEFETNHGGRLPIGPYLHALLERSTDSTKTDLTLSELASKHHLSHVYLQHLSRALRLESPKRSPVENGLIHELQQRWDAAVQSRSADDLENWIEQWQLNLWKFNSVGHIGKLNGPTSWLEPVSPISATTRIHLPITNLAGDYSRLTVLGAGDGNAGDVVRLKNPRFARDGELDIPLAEAVLLESLGEELASLFSQNTTKILSRLGQLSQPIEAAQFESIAKDLSIEEAELRYWTTQLGLSAGGNNAKDLSTRLLSQQARGISDIAGIDGWIGDNALSLIVNTTEQTQRIPGVMIPRSIVVHPAPDQAICLGFSVPTAGPSKAHALVQHVHTECGNGIIWSLEVVRAGVRIGLAHGSSNGANEVAIGPFEDLPLWETDEVVLRIAPRDNNHSCDATRVELTIEQAEKRWVASETLHDEILKANPLPDKHTGSWTFYSLPTDQWNASYLPSGSILAKWWVAREEARTELAAQFQHLLASPESLAIAAPQDQHLVRHILSTMREASLAHHMGSQNMTSHTVELETSNGRLHLDGDSLLLDKISWVRFPIPKTLREGWNFVIDAELDDQLGKDGSVQLLLSQEPPDQNEMINVHSNRIVPSTPILIHSSGQRREYYEGVLKEYRDLFPIALCYSQIVPVDEVVTLTLYHREDEHLQRLMLTETEKQELDRLWSNLRFVSKEAIQSVDAYEQLWQYATQDGNPAEFEPLKQGILDRVDDYHAVAHQAEPKHLEWLLQFARTAYRRELKTAEASELHHLYHRLREQEITHEASVRGVIAKILVSPEFLYRMERPGDQTQKQLDPYELATRLSYFLWASAPDDRLLKMAREGSLTESNTLRSEMRRMLKDPKAKRFANAFFGQWLQIANVHELDEKSESVFPEFVALRESFQGESNRFFEHLVSENRHPLELLTADYTFADAAVRSFYGISDPESNNESYSTTDRFDRVDSVGRFERGGIMRHASLLAKLSGASRTSAILRGTWISEVLLGEHLPKPPKNVPPLPESLPENLSERELIELHVSAAECSGCHKRIDPFGFALEQFDAIGRFREFDTVGRAIDSKTELPDGTQVTGHTDLIDYLCNVKKPEYLLQFHRKLLGYAIGREVKLSDRPFLDALVERANDQPDYGIWDAIEAVVLSKQFREIRGEVRN